MVVDLRSGQIEPQHKVVATMRGDVAAKDRVESSMIRWSFTWSVAYTAALFPKHGHSVGWRPLRQVDPSGGMIDCARLAAHFLVDARRLEFAGKWAAQKEMI